LRIEVECIEVEHTRDYYIEVWKLIWCPYSTQYFFLSIYFPTRYFTTPTGTGVEQFLPQGHGGHEFSEAVRLHHE
jgi:hypothetical protein